MKKKGMHCLPILGFRLERKPLLRKQRLKFMAKTSSIVKYQRNVKRVERYREKRLKLKETVRSPKSTPEEREEAQRKLAAIPRSALSVRLRHRCELTGRTRAVYKKFKMTRHKFRELAHKGFLPGVAKASW